jgi:hypothetical protein
MIPLRPLTTKGPELGVTLPRMGFRIFHIHCNVPTRDWLEDGRDKSLENDCCLGNLKQA